MTSTLIPTCAFCGLRFASGALLELHIREDHARPPRPAPAGHDDRAGPRASQAEHGEAAPAVGTGKENTGGGAMAVLRRITAAFRRG